MNKEHQKSLETFCIECEMGEGRLHNQRKFAKDLRQLLNDNAALRAEVSKWKGHELEWFQIIESLLGFHPTSQTDALKRGLVRVQRLRAALVQGGAK